MLRDWADLLSNHPEHLEKASHLLHRAKAIQAFDGLRLELAYSTATSARIALTEGRYSKAIDHAVDAANRFVQCANWRGWSEALEILFDSLAETRETNRMLSVANLAKEKLQLSNLPEDQRCLQRQALAFQAPGRIGLRAICRRRGRSWSRYARPRRLRRKRLIPRWTGCTNFSGCLPKETECRKQSFWDFSPQGRIGCPYLARFSRDVGDHEPLCSLPIGRKPVEVRGQDRASMGWMFAQSVLFTGHMIDAADRKTPRFPARAEAAARAAIRVSVGELRDSGGIPTVGIAGGASGGDLLFHEVCAELGVATRLRLALPVEEFIAVSVAPAGEDWVRRFRMLMKQLGAENVRVMGENDGRTDEATGDLWSRANLWMVEDAVALAPKRTLLALWDGQGGDGPGGTEHLVSIAPSYGIVVAPPILMQSLFA